jgi:hypothetical protein
MNNQDQLRADGLMTFGDVEDRLVEAMQLQWRTEGGRWPFASDGPWHLIRKEWSDWDARDAKPTPRTPLSRSEQARLNEAMGWLAMVPGDFERRLIVVAVTRLAAGDKQVPWRRLLAVMGLARGADGLRKRYGRALACLVRMLNAAEKRI